MTPTEVASKFRQYIDEPDQTFVSDADVETYLDDGYREFRNLVCDINPMIYNASQSITLSSVTELDLTTSTPSFLGSTPSATPGRLIRINEFNRVDSNGNTIERFEGVTNVTAVDVTASSYYLKGQTLVFDRPLTGTFSMEYVPEVNISWVTAPVDSFIDDLTAFHDLIALMAYRQYAITDGAENEPLIRQTMNRLQQFHEYLQARSHSTGDYVQYVSWYDY